MKFGIKGNSLRYKANKQIYMFLCYTFLSSLALAAFYNVLLSIYYTNLGYQEDFIGNVIAVRTLLIGLGSIPASMFAHRLGRRNAIIGGIILSGAGYLGLLIFGQYYAILASAAINGLGTAICFVNDAPLLSENSNDETRINALSLNFIVVNVAFIVGAYLAGRLPELMKYTSTVSIKYTLFVFTAIQIVSFIPLLKLVNKKGAKGRSMASSYFTLFKRKKLRYILYYNMFVGIGSGLVVPFFSLYVVYKFSVGTSQVGFILACSQIATIIGSAFIPYLSRRYSNMAIVLFCVVLSVPFLLSITVSGSILIVGLCFFIRYALMNMSTPAGQAIIMEMVSEEERSMFNSVIYFLSYIAKGISTSAAGFMMKYASYDLPYYIAAALYGMAALSFAGAFFLSTGSTANTRTDFKQS